MTRQPQLAIFAALAAVLLASGMTGAQARGGRSRTVTASAAPTAQAKVQATNIDSISVSPSTISFSATDPDLGLVTGSSSATVTFQLSGGNKNRSWTVGIQAQTSTFSGCTTVPASAVTATCSSVSVTHISGQPASGSCSSAFSLSSTSSNTVASGPEGGTDSFTVLINFTLSDSWQFIAATSPTCPLTLTYSLNAA